jgi:hypothetical protein
MKKRQGKRTLERPRHRWDDNIYLIFRKYDKEAWAELIRISTGTVSGPRERDKEIAGFIKCWEFFY